MAEPKVNELMEKIVSLCKRRGFIYQSSEIYGGIAGFWDYGPLGAELKRNVKDLWWRTMVHEREDVAGLEATIIMAPQIWKASGHVDTFADMMRECPVTKKRVRADQVESQSGTAYYFVGALYDPSPGYAHDDPDSDYGRRSVEDYIDRYAPASLAEIDKARLQYLISERRRTGGKYTTALEGEPLLQASNKILAYTCDNMDARSLAILVPAGKPAESAFKKAVEYYSGPCRFEVFPILLKKEQVTESVDFHPESGLGLGPARPFNLMFKTTVGPVEDADSVAYLRPETAQAIFAQFKNVLETSRQRVPFGIAQTGKAFRNEVTPRNFTFRSREFEQMELEFFIKPDEVIEAIHGHVAKVEELPGFAVGTADRPAGQDAQQRVPTATVEPQPNWGWEVWHKYWVEQRVRFYEGIGLPRTTLEEYWQKPEELAHYARACVDILFKFPFGTQELEGIAARSDFDLSQHQRFSGKSMAVFDEELKAAWAKLDPAKQAELTERYYQARLKYLTKSGEPAEKAEKLARADADGLAKGAYVPHVIEPSAGVDRLILALITHAYAEDEAPDDKGKLEKRVAMRFHPRIAPIKVAVFPLLKNRPELVAKAKQVRDLLRPLMTVFYDDAGAIGRRYRRQDEAGTPFGVTIDFDTLGEKGPELQDTVTLRDRDTMKQERVKIADLPTLLLQRLR